MFYASCSAACQNKMRKNFPRNVYLRIKVSIEITERRENGLPGCFSSSRHVEKSSTRAYPRSVGGWADERDVKHPQGQGNNIHFSRVGGETEVRRTILLHFRHCLIQCLFIKNACKELSWLHKKSLRTIFFSLFSSLAFAYTWRVRT